MSEISEIRSVLKGLSTERDDLACQVKCVRKEKSALERELGELRAFLRETKNENKRVVAVLEKEYCQMKKEYCAMRERLLQERLCCKRDNAIKAERLANLEAANEKLRKKLEQARCDCAKLKCLFKLFAQESKCLREQVEDETVCKNELQKENKALRKKLAKQMKTMACHNHYCMTTGSAGGCGEQRAGEQRNQKYEQMSKKLQARLVALKKENVCLSRKVCELKQQRERRYRSNASIEGNRCRRANTRTRSCPTRNQSNNSLHCSAPGARRNSQFDSRPRNSNNNARHCKRSIETRSPSTIGYMAEHVSTSPTQNSPSTCHERGPCIESPKTNVCGMERVKSVSFAHGATVSQYCQDEPLLGSGGEGRCRVARSSCSGLFRKRKIRRRDCCQIM
ncbi:hypothetical protein M8J77_024526 [Diaphorina citri]|nr:hypothetical protein M8J77_024526 [Diaphorina citri]